MYQIDNSTAATTQPASTAAGTAGFFTDGNPATSTPATIVPAEWLNAVMMELVNVVTGASLTLAKNQFNQVLLAIKRLGQATVILTDTGAANAYTATNAVPLVVGTWVDGIVQQVKISNTNTGASTYAPDGLTPIPIYGLGLQALQGGELFAGGTAVLMRLTIAGVNSGNPIAVLMECAGGAQQIAPALASRHAVQFGQVSGVVGTVRNLKMSVAAASASATLTADEIVVESALGGLRYCVASFNKTVNLATTGAGGMDVGTAPVSGYVALYAIYNPTTQTSALLAVNATSSAAPNVYGGANMPSGYTASALVSVWPTNGSGQFKQGGQRDRRVSLPAVQVLNSNTAQGSYTSFPISAAAPLNAIGVRGVMQLTSTAAGSNATFNIAGDNGGTGAQSCPSAVPSGGVGQGCNFALDIFTAQTLYYQTTSSGGTPTYIAYISAYDF
ncbi:MAG: hypothetical protein AAFW48_01760 [Pseudomonadota bacterium]